MWEYCQELCETSMHIPALSLYYYIVRNHRLITHGKNNISWWFRALPKQWLIPNNCACMGVQVQYGCTCMCYKPSFFKRPYLTILCFPLQIQECFVNHWSCWMGHSILFWLVYLHLWMELKAPQLPDHHL